MSVSLRLSGLSIVSGPICFHCIKVTVFKRVCTRCRPIDHVCVVVKSKSQFYIMGTLLTDQVIIEATILRFDGSIAHGYQLTSFRSFVTD